MRTIDVTPTAMAPVTNDADEMISFSEPYAVDITVVGTSPFLFHRWSVESVEAKSKAAKGSKAKKSDDLESYVYRNELAELCIPSEYFRMAIIGAAKFRQDPRSPRKSAMDLFKAAITGLEINCSLGVRDWSYVDQRRVMVQRNGITRSRPAMNTGWSVKVPLQVLLPEYVNPSMLNEVIQSARPFDRCGRFPADVRKISGDRIQFTVGAWLGVPRNGVFGSGWAGTG